MMIFSRWSNTVKVLFGFRRSRSGPPFPIAWLWMAAAAVLLFGAAGCKYGGGTEATEPKGEKQMSDTTGSSPIRLHNRPDIPPIDRKAPPDFQTATFALG
jgi:hypothetical protein